MRVANRSLGPESWIAIVLVILAAALGLAAYTASYWALALVYEIAAITSASLAVLVWTFGVVRRRWARRRKPRS
jgi:hypothetical protein